MSIRRITRKIVAFALGCGLGSACSTAPLPPKMLELVVRNASGAPIAAIERRACGAGEAGWSDVVVDEVDAGTTIRIPLPTSCVDLRARDRAGRVAGRQTGLVMLSKATWIIR